MEDDDIQHLGAVIPALTAGVLMVAVVMATLVLMGACAVHIDLAGETPAQDVRDQVRRDAMEALRDASITQDGDSKDAKISIQAKRSER